MSSLWPPSSSSSSSGSNDPLVLAQEVAKALQSELSFPYPVSNQYKDFTLYDEPPSRNKVSFQQKAGKDAPKKALGGEISSVQRPSDAELEELFCIVHGEFVRDSGVDIEHGMAFKEIKESQKRFLDFLNDQNNKPFSDYFLKQDGISDFFKIDPNDGKVKGTGYFFKTCYNNISNLWLVCHACNIEKSDDDALQWFREQKYFGEPFVKDVNSKGGLNPGIIFDIVGGRNIAQLPIGKSGVMRAAYSDGVGIGQSARTWFMKEYRYVYEKHKEFYTKHYQHLKDALDEIQALRLDGHIKEADEKFKRLNRELRLSEAAFGLEHPKHGDDSGSDSDQSTLSEQEDQAMVSKEKNTETVKNASGLNTIEELLKKIDIYSKSGKQVGDTEIHAFMKTFRLDSYRGNIVDNKLLTLKNIIKDYRKSGKIPDWESLQETITKNLESIQQELEKEKQMRLASDQRAENERQMRVASDQRADKEAQENAELKAEIARMKMEKQTQTAVASSSSSSSSDSLSSVNVSDSIMPLSSGLVELATNEPLVPYSDSENELDPSESTKMDLEKTAKDESSESRIAAAKHDGQLAREAALKQHHDSSASVGYSPGHSLTPPHHGASHSSASAQPANANSQVSNETKPDPDEGGHDHKRQKRR